MKALYRIMYVWQLSIKSLHMKKKPITFQLHINIFGIHYSRFKSRCCQWAKPDLTHKLFLFRRAGSQIWWLFPNAIEKWKKVVAFYALAMSMTQASTSPKRIPILAVSNTTSNLKHPPSSLFNDLINRQLIMPTTL